MWRLKVLNLWINLIKLWWIWDKDVFLNTLMNWLEFKIIKMKINRTTISLFLHLHLIFLSLNLVNHLWNTLFLYWKNWKSWRSPSLERNLSSLEWNLLTFYLKTKRLISWGWKQIKTEGHKSQLHSHVWISCL